MKQSFFFENRPFLYIFSGLIGYMVGTWLVFGSFSPNAVTLQFDKHGHLEPISVPSVDAEAELHGERIISPDRDFLNWHPEFLKWGVFIGLLMAFAGAILLPSILLNIKIIQDFSLYKDLKRSVRYFLAWVVLGGVYLWLVPQVNKWVLIPDELFGHLRVLYPPGINRHLPWISRLIVLPGILCLLGLFLLNLVIMDRNETNRQALEKKKKIDAASQAALQTELRKYFRFFSISISVLIAGGMLTSSLLRNVVYSVIIPVSKEVAASPEWKAISPSEHILIYGLNQVVFLAAILVPSFFFINRSGQLALKSVLMQDPETGDYLAEEMSPQRMLLQKIWICLLILMPFLALFANKLLVFLTGQLG